MLCSRRKESDRVSQVSARVRRRGREEHIELTAEASQITSAFLRHIAYSCMARGVSCFWRKKSSQRELSYVSHTAGLRIPTCVSHEHRAITTSAVFLMEPSLQSYLERYVTCLRWTDGCCSPWTRHTHFEHHSVTHQRSLPNNINASHSGQPLARAHCNTSK